MPAEKATKPWAPGNYGQGGRVTDLTPRVMVPVKVSQETAQELDVIARALGMSRVGLVTQMTNILSQCRPHNYFAAVAEFQRIGSRA